MIADLELPRHDDDATKSERGCMLVVGGSRVTPGGVLLAGLAALRVGAGKLQLATVGSVAVPLAVAVPEALVAGLPESDDGHLTADGAERVGDLAARADAVVLGPGVLDDAGMDALLAAILDRCAGVVVVDAGALRALGRHGRVRGRVIATPNGKELSALGADAISAAAASGAVVSCRDAVTTVAAPDGRTWEETAGCVGLATSGSGDVAVGAVGGLAAQGATLEAAAVWGARLHGLAGERLGGIGFLARELLDELPRVLADASS